MNASGSQKEYRSFFLLLPLIIVLLSIVTCFSACGYDGEPAGIEFTSEPAPGDGDGGGDGGSGDDDDA